MSAGETLRAAVIGAGWIGRSHAEVLAGRTDIEVVAVCDPDAERATTVAELSGAVAYSDWSEMLQSTTADAVWVCTPPKAHLAPALAAMQLGLPLYLEKPIARSLDDAAEITRAAAAAGVVCAVGYQWHAIEVLEDLRSGLGGQPVGCLVGQSIGGTESRPWFLLQGEGGGNVLERGSHHIDLARAIGGEIGAVQAASSTVRLAPRGAEEGDIADAVTIILHFEHGGLGTIVVAWTSSDVPGSYWVEVAAKEVSLRLDLDPDFRLSGVSAGLPVDVVSRATPFERSIGRFIEGVRAQAPETVFCTPADASRTLAVALAAEEALASGATVRVG